MKVSIVIATYNQERFIGKAIDSVLAQQVSFPVEILVGDDFSTDRTRDIIREYERRHPGLVRGVFHTRNLGKNGGINFLETLKQAEGEYYAAMDGDDYWTNPLKVQMQADFLDAHSDCSAVFHNALITYEDGSPEHLLNGPDMKPFFTLDDLVGEEEIWFMATSSLMYRNSIKEYPAWFRESVSGDIPRLILKAKQGNIGYLPEVMSVYRKNRGGTSFTDRYDNNVFLRNRIAMYEGINHELNYQYKRPLERNMARYYKMMLNAEPYRTSYLKRLPVIRKYISLAQPSGDELKELVRDYLLPPALLQAYSKMALGIYRLLHS